MVVGGAHLEGKDDEAICMAVLMVFVRPNLFPVQTPLKSSMSMDHTNAPPKFIAFANCACSIKQGVHGDFISLYN